MASSMLSLSTSCNLKCASPHRRFCNVSPILEKAPTIASRIPSLKAAQSPSKNPKSASTHCTFSPFPELDSHVKEVRNSLRRHVVVIGSAFLAPDFDEIHKSHNIGAGTYLDPTLVVTSAHAVGRIAVVPFMDAGSPLYKAILGSSAASTPGGGTVVKLTPLAVRFGSDVAVLKVEEGTNALPVCPVAESPPEKESIMMSLCFSEEKGWAVSVGNVRAVGQKSVKAKAPWLLDDEAAWIELDWMVFHRGPPPASSVLFNCKEKISGSVTNMSGSPWFNLNGELVGVASWVFRDDPASFSLGYAAPASAIRAVLDYAKSKGPHDPVVMDRWIKSEVVGA